MSEFPLLKMSRLILRSLCQKSACKMYPVEEPQLFEQTRGHLVIEPEKCIACSLCARKCPTGAITVDRVGEEWTLNRLACIVCGACVEACPKKCLYLDKQYTPPTSEKPIESHHVEPPTKPPKK